MRRTILGVSLVLASCPLWAAQRFTTAANVAIGTMTDAGNLTVNGFMQSPSSMNASGLFGITLRTTGKAGIATAIDPTYDLTVNNTMNLGSALSIGGNRTIDSTGVGSQMRFGFGNTSLVFVASPTFTPAVTCESSVTVKSSASVVGLQLGSGAFLNIGGQNKLTLPTTMTSSLTVVGSTVNAAYFVGIGADISSYSIAGASWPLGNYNIPTSGPFLGVATHTVTLRGGRPVYISYDIFIQNTGANAAEYTTRLTDNSVQANDDHIVTVQKTSYGQNSAGLLFPQGFSAGSHNFAVLIKSNTAGGTQATTDIHLNVQEF